MSESPTPTATSTIPPPPSRLPPPTGNFFEDVIQSIKHLTDIPCARNSLLGGIASGAGIGVVRGMSTTPLAAGNWAMATFTIISLGSFHLCQKKMIDERNKVTKVLETMPRRIVKQDSDAPTSEETKSQ